MRKELGPIHDDISCDICGRTILKGERTEPYLAPGGQRKLVCDLCATRAEQEGWIRESAHGDLPAARRRAEPRRSFWGRLFDGGRRDEPIPASWDADAPEPGAVAEASPDNAARIDGESGAAEAPPSRRKQPRHVHAVPTNAQVKVERALEVFNASTHPKTIAGITKTLGAPWVSATAALGAPSEVGIVVAWELSWYRYRVDLGDADEPVALLEKGHELADLDESLRAWNATAEAGGSLSVGVGSPR